MIKHMINGNNFFLKDDDEILNFRQLGLLQGTILRLRYIHDV